MRLPHSGLVVGGERWRTKGEREPAWLAVLLCLSRHMYLPVSTCCLVAFLPLCSSYGPCFACGSSLFFLVFFYVVANTLLRYANVIVAICVALLVVSVGAGTVSLARVLRQMEFACLREGLGGGASACTLATAGHQGDAPPRQAGETVMSLRSGGKARRQQRPVSEDWQTAVADVACQARSDGGGGWSDAARGLPAPPPPAARAAGRGQVRHGGSPRQHSSGAPSGGGRQLQNKC